MAKLRARLKEALHKVSLFGKAAEVAAHRKHARREELLKAEEAVKDLFAEHQRELKDHAPLRQREDTLQMLALAEHRESKARAKLEFWRKAYEVAQSHHTEWGEIVRRRRRKLRKWLRIHRTYGAGGFAPSRFWVRQRVDQGQDFEIALGKHLRSPGDGTVIEWAHDGPFPSGFGDPYAVVSFSTGPFAGLTLYIGHVNEDVPPVGTQLKEGDRLGKVTNSLHPGLGWAEIGLWPPGPMGNGAKIADRFVEVRA